MQLKTTLAPSTLETSIGQALLDSAMCVCHNSARRVIVEYDPIKAPSYDKRSRDKTRRLVITTWCGNVDMHQDDWRDDARNDGAAVAMTENDM